ncbi:hypothetical protein D3C81_1309840 [compost metagenome]
MLQVTRRQRDAAGIAVNWLTDEAGQLPLLGGQCVEPGIDVTQVIGGALGATIGAAIGVRCNHRVYPVRPCAQGLGVVGDGGGNRIGSYRPAVIGLEHTQQVAPTAVGPGQTDRQVVGLGAAVDQKHPVEAFWRQLQQAFGELGDGRVMEARVGVEQRPLAR